MVLCKWSHAVRILSVCSFFKIVLCSKDFRIGLLLPRPGPKTANIPNSMTSGGAVLLAQAEAAKLYKDVNVTLIWQNNTGCDEYQALIPAFSLWKKADVILGPPCAKELGLTSRAFFSLLTQVTWLPSDLSSAITTYGNYTDITESIITVLNHFNWMNIGIISTDNEMCEQLLQTVNDHFPNQNFNIRGLTKVSVQTNESYASSLQNMKGRATVILICVPSGHLADFLLQARKLDMVSGDYVFIYFRFGPDPEHGLSRMLASPSHRSILSTLLQIGSFENNKTTIEKFKNESSAQKSSAIFDCCGQADEYSILLYETVLATVAAFARNTSIDPKQDLTHYMAGNFTTKFSGALQTNKNGTILRKVQLSHFQNGRFETVGRLVQSPSGYSVVKDIAWPKGRVKDSPLCGWDGSQCEKEGSDAGVIAGSVIAGTIGVVAVCVFIIMYRKFKFEKELLGMIWKVNSKDIRRPRTLTQTSQQRPNIHPRKKLNRADTRQTLGLGSTSSIDRNVLYAPVGNYKGSIVAVKNIQRRSIHLSREILKDFKALRELQHENLNPFIGANLEPDNSYILTKYCAKGSLQDVLENDNIQLDYMFQMSFIIDIARGLEFLHRSPVRSHGNLKSTNCVIDSRWVLKITDFGAIVSNVQEDPNNEEEGDHYYSSLFWTAPELLRMQKRPSKGTQKGDVYSFGIIQHEIMLRCHPYYYNNAPSAKAIIKRIRIGEDPPYRPRTPEEEIPEKVENLIFNCWQEAADFRLDMHNIHKHLIDINGGRKMNIMDNMIQMLEAYSTNLEELVAARTEELALEKQKTDILLYQMLPPLVAEQLKVGEHVRPETFDEASLFFSDIVGFTTISSKSTPLQVIDLLNDLYTTFDNIISMHDVYKVETIGDAYMCASGIPRQNGKRHSGEIANMALDLLSATTSFKIRHMEEEKLQLRIGLHTGTCAAGVVGLTMPRFCLFGDTVNMASRMESTGKAFHIHVSSDMRDALEDLNLGFMLMQRGVIEVKGKGLQMTYWLVGTRKFSKQLPDEVESLRQVFEEAENSGRPLSPTGSHISSGSLHENTSMYGNAFRRASIAISFLKSFSNIDRSNNTSPSASRSASEVSMKDLELCETASNELTIPKELLPQVARRKRSRSRKPDPATSRSRSPSPHCEGKPPRAHKTSRQHQSKDSPVNNTSPSPIPIPKIEIS